MKKRKKINWKYLLPAILLYITFDTIHRVHYCN